MRAAASCALLIACGPSPRAQTDAAAMVDAPRAIDAQSQAAGPVDVVITADNAYSFGYGDAGEITHFMQGARAQTAGQIFNCPMGEGPESYTVPEADAPDGAYLYIVTWDDLGVTQGVIGTFSRTTGTVLTGDSRFEVCATGLDYSTSDTGPPLAVINTEIQRCNNGSGDAATTSKGWVSVTDATTTGALGQLAVGEANDAEDGTFHVACQSFGGVSGIPSDAHWMWYDPMDGSGTDAFHATGANRTKAFLIFRLGAGVIIE
jgi:hypothetical protein